MKMALTGNNKMTKPQADLYEYAQITMNAYTTAIIEQFLDKNPSSDKCAEFILMKEYPIRIRTNRLSDQIRPAVLVHNKKVRKYAKQR